MITQHQPSRHRHGETGRDILSGVVERVTSIAAFCVLRVMARDQGDLITVIGFAMAIGAGEFVQASSRRAVWY